MNKEFIPYQQALELKELGFDEPCFGSWETEHVKVPTYTHSISEFYTNSNHPRGKITAPLYQQAFRWFREKYGLNSCIDGLIGRYYYNIRSWKNEAHESYYNTYEEAELACLNKLIEIVKGGEQ